MIKYFDVNGNDYTNSHVAPAYMHTSGEHDIKDGWYYLDECQQVSNTYNTFEEAKENLLMYVDYCLNGTGNDRLFYYEGDMFQPVANPPYILAHACNCKGVWGSGVAKIFAQKFPREYSIYKEHCENHGNSLLGTCLLIKGEISIACLFTSDNYGQFVDPPERILRNTELALKDMFSQVDSMLTINMPKINSGLFKVPWENTEKIIRKTKPLTTIVNVYSPKNEVKYEIR